LDRWKWKRKEDTMFLPAWIPCDGCGKEDWSHHNLICYLEEYVHLNIRKGKYGRYCPSCHHKVHAEYGFPPPIDEQRLEYHPQGCGRGWAAYGEEVKSPKEDGRYYINEYLRRYLLG